jgi:hypothetical protein
MAKIDCQADFILNLSILSAICPESAAIATCAVYDSDHQDCEKAKDQFAKAQ